MFAISGGFRNRPTINLFSSVRGYPTPAKQIERTPVAVGNRGIFSPIKARFSPFPATK